jgi:hypothetical protein
MNSPDIMPVTDSFDGEIHAYFAPGHHDAKEFMDALAALEAEEPDTLARLNVGLCWFVETPWVVDGETEGVRFEEVPEGSDGAVPYTVVYLPKD